MIRHALTTLNDAAAHRTKARKLSSKQGPEAERIEAFLETPEGAALYRRRQQMIEPVFANTKFIRGIAAPTARSVAGNDSPPPHQHDQRRLEGLPNSSETAKPAKWRALRNSL